VLGSEPATADRPADEVSLRLAALADEITRELGPAVEVERNGGDFRGAAHFTPTRSGALAVWWIDFGDALLLQTGSGLGGRFELHRSPADAEFVADFVRSVVDGRAVEVFALGRSRLTVTLQDGSRRHEPGHAGPAGLVPLPLWPRWGRRVEYLPYR